MNKIYVYVYQVIIDNQSFLYLNELSAYNKLISEINEELKEFEKMINSDPCNKQPLKSKNCISNFRQIKDVKEAYNYYKFNIDNIYDYFYDGGNECWQTFLHLDISIEELPIYE
jgi:CRISPR/Cas system CMR-associated protein Cmr1 (group 7 of RAMP superfamily)